MHGGNFTHATAAGHALHDPTSTASNGAVGAESGRLPLQPREMKFSPSLHQPDSRFSETSGGRRGFKAPTKLHALTGKPVRPAHTFDPEVISGDALALWPGGKGDPAPGMVRSPKAVHAATATPAATASGFTVQSTSDNSVVGSLEANGRTRGRRPAGEHNPLDLRRLTAGAVALPAGSKWVKGRSKGGPARSLAPLPPATAEAQRRHQHLQIEGNSLLSAETAEPSAAAALAQLSDCVAEERRLREQWDAAREAKLKAFRGVIRTFRNSWLASNTKRGSTAPPDSTAAPDAVLPSRAYPDSLAVAKCAVVTHTLVTTVQSYVRAKQSRQLVLALAHIRRVLGSAAQHPVDYNATLTLRSATQGDSSSLRDMSNDPFMVTANSSLGCSLGTATDDVLDLEEVARLRQLYFDYYDCEPVTLSSLEESNAVAHGFAPPQGCSPNPDIMNSTNPSSVFSSTMSSSVRQGDAHSYFSQTM